MVLFYELTQIADAASKVIDPRVQFLAGAGFAGWLLKNAWEFLSSVIKTSKNGGKPKDETKEISPWKLLHPCKDDTRFQTHVTEAHDTKVMVKDHKGDSKERDNAILKELRKHTTALQAIAKNGTDK